MMTEYPVEYLPEKDTLVATSRSDGEPVVDTVALQAAADKLRNSLPNTFVPTGEPVSLTRQEVEADLVKILKSYEMSGLLLNHATGAQVEAAVSGFVLEAQRLGNVDKFDFFIDFVSSVDPEELSTVVTGHNWSRSDNSVRFASAVSTANFGYIFVLVVDRDQFIRNNPRKTRAITSKLYLGGMA